MQSPECITNFDAVFGLVGQMLETKKNLIIAIDGNCGSGKSYLASRLAESFNANVFHIDDFFIPDAQKDNEKFMQIAGNVDITRFKSEVVRNILSGTSFSYSKYNCKFAKFTEEEVSPKEINVIEGAFSMHPKLIDIYDIKIFFTVNKAVQLERIRKRNGDYCLKRFESLWIPRENQYFEAMNIPSICDIIVDTSDLW